MNEGSIFIKIFHNPKFYEFFLTRKLFIGEHVATLEIPKEIRDRHKESILPKMLLELAFEATNSIDSPWYRPDNPDIALLGKDTKRSTSVGDIVQIDDTYYVCESIGYTRLTRNEVAAASSYMGAIVPKRSDN